MYNPLVSVLIPAYNHENYIEDTIRSIINQTYKNIELIIVDDGSKDATWQKMQKMEPICNERFHRVIFQTKTNEGTCKTFNKLLSLAKGDFVYIIASDYMAKPNAIEKEIKFLQKHKDYSLVVGDNEIIDSEGKVCYWGPNQEIIYDIKQATYKTFGDMLQKNVGFGLKSKFFGSYETLYRGNYVPNGYLIRKSVLDKIGYFTPEAPLEDWWLMCQISKYARMKYLDDILFSYRWHSSNTIRNKDKINHYMELNAQYENRLLEKIDKKSVLPEVLTVKKYGGIVRVDGISPVFCSVKRIKDGYRVKTIKLFGIPIYKKKKLIK